MPTTRSLATRTPYYSISASREGLMTDKKIEKAKGRVKEAAGALTGDRHLKE